MSVEQLSYRDVLSQLATGVAVLTVNYGGVIHGITVNAFCYLSHEPSLVLVCIKQDSYFLSLIERSRSFGVNILAETGEPLARHFASRTSTRFLNIAYRLSPAGIPLLQEALATIECRVVNQYPGGDHSIVTGEIFNAEVVEYSQPLVYFRRGYRRLEDTELTSPAR